MNLELNDREKRTVIVALDLLRSVKQEQLVENQKKPVNEHDLLSTEHSLMHSITLLSRLTKRPIEHFANPNPSQQPSPKTHTAETKHPKQPKQPQ